jgi:thiamine-monophosphate kinase
MPLSEFEIIESWFRHRAGSDPELPVGIGDDGAVIRPGAGELAWVVDTVNAGVHFPEDCDPADLGHRVLAVNLSDLVAMAAVPRWCLLSLSLPEADRDWLDRFCDGFFALAGQAGVTLAGGDLTRGPLSATVTAIGRLAGRRVLRSGARAGDRVLVSGTLGDAHAGLELALSGEPLDEAARWLRQRYLRPEPRLALVPLLAAEAGAAIDVSDGLAGDLGHILAASGLGAEIEAESLPLSDELVQRLGPAAAREAALFGGDDYEICFTVSEEKVERVLEAAVASRTALSVIGRMTEAPGLRLREGTRIREIDPAAFRHFGSTDE